MLKVILLGSSNVGKTSILNRYVRNVFFESSKPTVGVDFVSKPVTREEIKTACSTSCVADCNQNCADHLTRATSGTGKSGA